jgi:hypothetical protein
MKGGLQNIHRWISQSDNQKVQTRHAVSSKRDWSGNMSLIILRPKTKAMNIIIIAVKD